MIISIRGAYIDEAFFRKKRFVCCVDDVTLVGKTISHYEIVEKLGGGGMGIVYKARDRKLGRFVALKFLNKELLSDDESYQRFHQEAKVISSLDHPNIATIHEIDETDDSVFISMAYYEGQTLAEYIANQGPLAIEDICSIAIRILQGLAKAHHSGIIHRDIKPANIMITSDEQVKILDFGLAKVVDQTAFTKGDSILGTVAYMSPEQVQGFPVDHRSDIFSFGAVLYEMITGERPFPGEYMASVAYTIVNEEPVSIRKTRPEIPQPFENVVNKALQKEPDNRYQNIEETKADLEAIRQSDSGSPTVPKASLADLKPRLSKRAWIASIGIVLLIFTVTLVFLLQSVGEAPRKISSIAVIPFVVKDAGEEWKWLGNAVMDLLNTELAQYPSVNTMDAQKWNRLQDKLGIQDDGNMTLEETFRIAREAKAENILMGSVEKHGNNLSLQAQVFDTRSGNLLKTIPTVEGNVSHFYDLVDRLSNELKQSLEFEVSASRKSQSVSDLTTQSLDAYKHYLEGRDAALDNRYKEAIPKLRWAIRLDSTFIQAYYYLAWQYTRIYENDLAKEVLLKGKPHISGLSEEEQLRYLEMDASVDERWTDYSTYIERRLKLNPSNASLHYRFGYIQFYYFRNVDAGIREMEKALQLDSTYIHPYKDLANAYLAKGERTKALTMIKKYVEVNSADVEPLSSMANIQILTGQYEEAEANCERALMLQPNMKDAVINLARLYLAQGRHTLALETINQYLESVTVPAHRADCYLILGKAYYHQKKLKEATGQLVQAIRLDSSYSDALWMQGLIQLELGKKAAAQSQLSNLERILLAKDGIEDEWLIYHLKAQIKLYEKEYDHAIKYLNMALDCVPLDRAFYLNSLADALLQSGQFDAAVKKYQEALGFNPKNLQTVFGLAKALEKQRKLRKALGAYNDVLELWSEADNGIEEIEIAKKKLKELRKFL